MSLVFVTSLVITNCWKMKADRVTITDLLPPPTHAHQCSTLLKELKAPHSGRRTASLKMVVSIERTLEEALAKSSNCDKVVTAFFHVNSVRCHSICILFTAPPHLLNRSFFTCFSNVHTHVNGNHLFYYRTSCSVSHQLTTPSPLSSPPYASLVRWVSSVLCSRNWASLSWQGTNPLATLLPPSSSH